MFKFEKANTDAEKAVQKFLGGATEGKNGEYFIQGDELKHKYLDGTATYYRESYWNSDSESKKARQLANFNKLVKLGQEGKLAVISVNDNRIEYKPAYFQTVAKRLPNGAYIGNSSKLANATWSRLQLPVQTYLAQFVPMLPFNVFQEAKLDLNTMQVIEQGKAETITRKETKVDSKGRSKEVLRNIHFTGASLFSIGNKTYLFDVDRRELQHYIFNPFLVEIPTKVKTIGDAYSALMPKIVKQAIAKGMQVKRQGEWFFIPTRVTSTMLKGKKIFGGKGKKARESLTLQAGERNRPNRASQGFLVGKREAIVKGTVSHSGREHANLRLVGWHRAVPNTAFDKSFTVMGDVD